MLWWTLRKLKSKNWVEKLRTIEKLGDSRDPRVVEPLIAELTNSSGKIRVAAAVALGQIGDTRAIEPLIAAFNDPSNEVRAVVVRALDALGWQPVDDTHRALWAIALGRWEEAVALGTPAIEPLAIALKEGGAMRRSAAKALGQIEDERAFQALVSVLYDDNPDVATIAAETLGELRDRRAVPPLMNRLNTKSISIQTASVKALGEIGDARAVERLLGMLHIRTYTFESRNVQLEVVKALAKIGDTRAIEPLIAFFHHRSSEVRAVVVRALNALGWQPVNDTQRALRAIALESWEEAIKLGTVAVEALAVALNDESVDVERRVARVLGEQGDTPVTDLLIATLEHQDYGVQQEAVKSLGNIGDARAVMPLITVIKESNTSSSVENAVRALEKVLGRTAASVTPEDLREAARLGDMNGIEHISVQGDYSVEEYDEPWTVSCSQIRRLARQELIHRGLEL
jgi:HEAT repeat protein